MKTTNEVAYNFNRFYPFHLEIQHNCPLATLQTNLFGGFFYFCPSPNLK